MGLKLEAITAPEVLPSILRKVRFGTLDELYAAIGYGGMSAQKAVVRVKDEMARLDRLHAEQSAAAQEPIHPSTSNPPTVPSVGARPASRASLWRALTTAWSSSPSAAPPCLGNPIVGFITRGYGVSVHRADCPNAVTGMQHPQEKDRWIKVSWDPTA